MSIRILLVLLLTPWALSASQNYCEPSAQVQSELQKAASMTGTDRTDFEQNVAPFRTLRTHHPGDLFVQERYQDAVQQHGIEGHLRALIEEYQSLQAENPEDWKYQYLFNRALIGRNTRSAIAGLSEIAQNHPDFAPVHRMLVQIYAIAAYGDEAKARSEQEKLQTLCPGLVVTPLPDILPAPSPLINEAEALLAGTGDPGQITQLTNEAIRADEWRLQRVRPFDWYSVDYKRQQQNDLQIEYWHVWEIQVTSYRKAQQFEKANALLNTMEARAAFLHDAGAALRRK